MMITTDMPIDIPSEYKDEIDGMFDGCVRVNPETKVTKKALWVLNIGIDSILAFIYTGRIPDQLPVTDEYKKFIKVENFRVPIMCNAYSISGTKVKDNGNYFGRDFMFPTANVFQKVACYVIRKPDNGALPTVSVCAPGMIGSISGLNTKSIAVGIDMSPSGNCNPSRIGFNSLLLNRQSIQYGDTCENAVNEIVKAKRGVSWNYILVDGKNNRSCVVEAGYTTSNLDFLSYVPKDIKDSSFIPSEDYIRMHISTEVKNGTMGRWNDYRYPLDYLKFNKPLMDFMKEYKKKLVPLAILLKDYDYNYNDADFSDKGYLNKTRKGTNCPCGYYFAPQKEDMNDLLLATNHYVIPEMRLCAMNEWTQFISSGNIQDIQWRYDELTNQLLSAIDKGPVDYNLAKEIIDFLAPYRKYSDYYNADGKPLTEVFVHGSISLMDLKNNVIDTLYGYYSDQWVTVHLNEYFK